MTGHAAMIGQRALARLLVVLTASVVGCSSTDEGVAAPVDAGTDTGTAWRDEPPIDPASLLQGKAPFEDVAAKVGLPAIAGLCVVFDDFDGDGRPDAFLGSFSGAPQKVALYRNDGAGKFVEKVLPPIDFAKGAPPGWCAAGDLDGDGLLDVVLAGFAAFDIHVLHNKGGGAFEDVQRLTPTLDKAIGIGALALADLDGDGYLDLIAAPIGVAPPLGPDSCAPHEDGFRCWSPGTRCAPAPLVFPGGASFGAPKPLLSTACGPANVNALSVVDWNGDGLPDVFASNDWGANAFWVQGPKSTFTDVAPTLGLKPYNSAMGAAVEDFDGDGALDLYVADTGSDQLYLGGPAPLSNRARAWGVAEATKFHSGWSPLAQDFDSDGRLDLWVANAAFTRSYRDLATIGGRGLPERIHPQFDLYFQGDGRGFRALGLEQTKVAEATMVFGATATADFDGDGRLDVLETIGFPMRVQLLRNTGPNGHWVRARLKGKGPNVDGIGATVTMVAGGRKTTRYLQRMHGTNGSSWPIVHFGLGDATSVERLEVRWPDGVNQTVSAPGVDAMVEIVHP